MWLTPNRSYAALYLTLAAFTLANSLQEEKKKK